MNNNQGSRFRTVPADTAGIYRAGQCIGIGTPPISYRKKYWSYWRNPAVSPSKWIRAETRNAFFFFFCNFGSLILKS